MQAEPQLPLAVPAAPRRRVFTVSRVVERADQVLRQAASRAVWVRGEVSNWSRHRSGHCFFRIKDEHAELDCVLWRDRADGLPALPEEGLEVDVLGTLGIYARRGQFRLEVERVEATGGDGLWHVARQRLLDALRAEGLLDEERKRPIPRFPERVGLVTSPGAAALQDMWRTMRRRAWWVNVVVSGCAVEGAGAAPDVVRALRRFGTGPDQTPVDLVIVARGGGSRESLWAFNTEPVARAIAACPFPTISAVGHETDFTVADFVADVRAATPTAGAEYATPDGRELLERLETYPAAIGTRMRRLVSDADEDLLLRTDSLRRRILRRHEALQQRLAAVERTTHARAPRERHDRLRERLEAVEAALGRAIRQRLERMELGLAGRAAEAEAKSPLRALARGYAVVSTADGVVRDPDDAPAGTPLRIQLAGGTLRATSDGPDPESTPDGLP